MRVFWIAAAMLAVGSGASRAERGPDPQPMLRIEAGMHVSAVNRIGVSAACSLMATGSDDKTARLWALPPGGRGSPLLLQTLRPPIGDGNEGKVFSVALSPDGKWVAAGGWDAHYAVDKTMFVYIFEAATGRLGARLGPLTNVIHHLAFSADGRFLAASLGAGEGVRVWATNGWNLVAQDKDYGGRASYGAAFGLDGVLYTAADDGFLRRYAPNTFKLEAKAKAQGGTEPFSVAAHPKGGQVAVGFADSTAVDVYDARSLRRLFAADTSGVAKGNLGRVAWSADGAQLYAGGRYGNNGAYPLLIWQDSGRGRRTEAPLSQNTIMQLLPCGRNLAAGTSDPAFGFVDGNGGKLFWQEGATVDMRTKLRDAFTVSHEGGRVRFGLGVGGETPVLFDLDRQLLTDAEQQVSGLEEPRTESLAVADWQDKATAKFNGKPFALERYETSRSLAIAPDASRFVLGTDWTLRSYRNTGVEVWKKAVPGTVWGVNITGNGQVVVAAYDDGTIRWHRMSDGQELLALFVHKQDRRFVVWTPKGYYMASPGAEDLIGWHVNRGWSEAADFFPASSFRNQFNRPDVVRLLLETLDEDRAIDQANLAAKRKREDEDVRKRLPPVITVLSPSEGAIFGEGSLQVRYRVRSPSGLAITEVLALADGRPLPGAIERGLQQVSGDAETEGTLTLSGLPERDLTLSLVARAGETESVPAVIRLKYGGRAADLGAKSGSLYALVVGAGTFKDRHVSPLRWAAKDAKDFAAALEAQSGTLYRKVEIKLITGEDADNGAILDGLEWLQRQVNQGDMGVIYFSGHGIAKPGGDYYYLAYNSRLEDVGGLSLPTRSTAVPDSEIAHTLKQLAGNALFFFDTGNAGKAAGIGFRGGNDTNKVINELANSSNAMVLASSTGNEESIERDDWQNGAFTKALLEGLAGAADVLPKDGYVSFDELALYVKDRVKELTGGLQHPVDLRPKESRNITFAKVP